ncbi:redoxin domain-containing protein [Paenibacillus gansuensis]|uniref:Redoxin domain-containing protein n=1 Tax=Paenibacillus gansuensis TaxID=306542 RepID=A0ABW5PFC4_9BACL
MNYRKWIVITAAFIVAGLIGYQFNASKEASAVTMEQAPKKNHMAPSFSLKSMDGGSYQVGGTRDKMLLLNFWASWCGPCKEEAPELKAFYDQNQDRLDVYAVNSTMSDKQEDAVAFVKQYGFTFPSFLDPQGKVSDLYSIMAFPTSYLIDQEGIIREVIYGAVDPKELKKQISRWSR